MARFDVGQIMPITRGEWNEETTYKICDVVRYEGTSYWVRKDGIRGIEPTGKTDANYQMLVHDYVENRYVDAVSGVVVEYAGENPRENGFVEKLMDAAYGRGSLFADTEELKNAAEKGNCVILTPLLQDGGGQNPNEIDPGERIVCAAFQVLQENWEETGAIMLTSNKTATWIVAKDSSGTESVVAEEEFRFRGAKREANLKFVFNDEYYGDFGTGGEEEGLITTVTAELPESSLLILLPGMLYEGNGYVEDKTFKDAEIVVKSYAFSVVEEYGRKYPQLTLTLLAHNKDVKGKTIYGRVFAI